MAITYTIKASSEGRVSDINCFWMATSPHDPDLFAPGHGRTGKFTTYDTLKNLLRRRRRERQLHHQIPSLHRHRDRPLLPEHDLSKPEHMIVPDKEYSIRLIAAGNRAQYYRDGELLFDFEDPEPLEKGHFAFRTVNSHLVVDDFAVYEITDIEAALNGAEPPFN